MHGPSPLRDVVTAGEQLQVTRRCAGLLARLPERAPAQPVRPPPRPTSPPPTPSPARRGLARAAAHRPPGRDTRALRARRAAAGRCRSACPGELLPRRRGPGARLSRPAGADRRALRARPVRRGGRASGSTAPATWRAGGRTASSSSWAASTTRSRSAASASSWARSRRRCARHPAVREAAVVAREDAARRAPAGGLRGRATGGRSSRPASCATSCAERLPEYMVPVGLRGPRRRCR